MNLFNKDNAESHQINAERATENIIPQKRVEKIIHDCFWDLSNMIKCTIGPCGGNTLVTEPYADTPIFPTKDGYRVMNNHCYNDVPYESIYRIIRDISSRMNQILGDGTTTGVVIAAKFYDEIMVYLKHHKEITPYGIKKLLDLILEEINKVLNDKGYVKSIKDLDKDTRLAIYNKIATISANNDSSIGNAVAGAYAKSTTAEAYIDIKESTNSEDHIETDLGFELANGYVLTHMATEADGITAKYEDPLYLIVDGPLLDSDFDNLAKYVHWVTEEFSPSRALVIIASEYSKKIMDYFTVIRTGVQRIDQRTGRPYLVKLPVIALAINNQSEWGIAHLSDLEACLGAKAIKTDNGKLQTPPNTEQELMLMLGRSDEIESRYAFTRIRGGGGSPEVKKGRIEEIENMIKASEDEGRGGLQAASRIENMRRRIGMLQGQMHCIYVGGDSFKEKKERSLVFEDAVMATKACIEHGVMLGGQVSIPNAIRNYKDTIIDSVEDVIYNSGKTYNIAVNLTKAKLRNIVSDILDVISDSSEAGFKAVFENATNDKKWIKKVFDTFHTGELKTYNLISGKFEGFESKAVTDSTNDEGKTNTVVETEYPDLIVPGNTDYELLKSVFAIVGLFITSNQLISVHVQKNNVAAK